MKISKKLVISEINKSLGRPRINKFGCDSQHKCPHLNLSNAQFLKICKKNIVSKFGNLKSTKLKEKFEQGCVKTNLKDIWKKFGTKN